MAAALIKKAAQERGLDITVRSAGLRLNPGDGGASRHAIDCMNSYGLDISDHVASRLTKADVESADLVLVMGARHKTVLAEAVPGASPKVHTIREYCGLEGEVSDPYGGDLPRYRETASELSDLAGRVVERLDHRDGAG